MPFTKSINKVKHLFISSSGSMAKSRLLQPLAIASVEILASRAESLLGRQAEYGGASVQTRCHNSDPARF